MEYIEVPDGLIEKDLIRQVIKSERETYEGDVIYRLSILQDEEKFTRIYEKSKKYYNKAEQWRDELYDNIKKQLTEKKS